MEISKFFVGLRQKHTVLDKEMLSSGDTLYLSALHGTVANCLSAVTNATLFTALLPAFLPPPPRPWTLWHVKSNSLKTVDLEHCSDH